jgi:hypothetical protein
MTTRGQTACQGEISRLSCDICVSRKCQGGLRRRGIQSIEVLVQPQRMEYLAARSTNGLAHRSAEATALIAQERKEADGRTAQGTRDVQISGNMRPNNAPTGTQLFERRSPVTGTWAPTGLHAERSPSVPTIRPPSNCRRRESISRRQSSGRSSRASCNRQEIRPLRTGCSTVT